jgi:predicted Zn-dependent protease
MRSRSRPPTWLLLGAFVLAGAGCATNPVTGRPEFVLLSESQEVELGRKEAAEIAESVGVVEAPQLEAYLDAIGQRLARENPRRELSFRFHVIDMAEPNAFALPGGDIYASRGLLALSNSEDEIACVLGHEVGHVAARHGAKGVTRGILAGVGSIIAAIGGAILFGEQGAQLGSALGQLAGGAIVASYSRDQERQADELGQAYAARAGWDPAGMAAFLASLESAVALTEKGQRYPSFFDTHPATPERVQSTRRRATGLERAPAFSVAKSQRAFLSKLEGLLVGADPAQGVFQDEVFVHPDLGFSIRFPKGWQTQNTRQAVLAASTQGDVAIRLDGEAAGSDPRAAAAAFEQSAGVQLAEPRSLRVDGRSAYNGLARASDGSILDLTWIAHRGQVLRVIGISTQSRYSSARATFARTVESFRDPTSAELGALEELRLRVVETQSGETLRDLSERSGNRWSVQETAVANGLDPGVRLGAGRLIKIAVARPYRGGR